MMGMQQKMLVASVALFMNVAVWGFGLLVGGLFGIAIAVMFTMFSGGAMLRLMAA